MDRRFLIILKEVGMDGGMDALLQGGTSVLEAEVGSDLLSEFVGTAGQKEFQLLHEEMNFEEYLAKVMKYPKLIRSAFQRVYDMIMSSGTTRYERYRRTVTHYKFFDEGSEPIFGLDDTLEELVKHIKGGAGHFGVERRLLLLVGPVGSSKSTICRRLKRGMEAYSRTDAGAWYTYKWVDLPTGGDGIYNKKEEEAALHEEPLLLLPEAARQAILTRLNATLLEGMTDKERNTHYTLKLEGEVNPRSKLFLEELLKRHNGDLVEVLRNHVRVVRKVYSEADRMGIGTFQPKDSKNQDSTELSGDVNFAQMRNYGVDSDPRAFDFSGGEFCVANRGLCEFIEVLKLDQEFLYDLLGATQEHSIKPKKFSQVSIDEFLISHTNMPEFTRLMENKQMEALRDRTIKIPTPWVTRWSDEIKIYERDYGNGKVRQHVAPHTLRIAAMFAVMTRLKHEKDDKLDLRDKAKLYDGRVLPGYTEDQVKEIRDRNPGEGVEVGIGPRYVQDQISGCLSEHHDYINAFMVMNRIKERLESSALVSNNKEDLAKFHLCIDLAKKELSEILKEEVQKAMVGDDKAIARLCHNYVDNVMAYLNKQKVRDKYTGEDVEPNERLMREIEEHISIPDQAVDDFRRSLSTFIAGCYQRNEKFEWNSNPKLEQALKRKLFSDVRDTIKLSSMSRASEVVDKDQREKIDDLKRRLIKHFGYNEQSASDVLDYVSNIFARGGSEDDD